MKKRMVYMLLGILLLVGAVVGWKYYGYMKYQKTAAAAPVPSSTVTSTKAEFQQWQPQITAVGTLRALALQVGGVGVDLRLAQNFCRE